MPTWPPLPRRRSAMADLRVTTFDLLRHGRCEGGEMFRGSTDVALLDSGLEAMAGALSGLGGWQRIVSSPMRRCLRFARQDRKSTRLNSSHVAISYAVFCLKKKKTENIHEIRASC